IWMYRSHRHQAERHRPSRRNLHANLLENRQADSTSVKLVRHALRHTLKVSCVTLTVEELHSTDGLAVSLLPACGGILKKAKRVIALQQLQAVGVRYTARTIKDGSISTEIRLLKCFK